jgi:hypothetical protein
MLMLNLLIRSSRFGRFRSQADMQMVVFGNQTGGNGPLSDIAECGLQRVGNYC